MLNRRNLLAATAVAAGSASLLTACGLDQKPAPAASPSGSGGSTAAAPVAFTIYTARDKKLAESVVADFEKKYPEWAGKATILTLGAQEALERVRQNGRPWRMPPLNSMERRIIHQALKDLPDIRTHSEDEDSEGRKRVVISIAEDFQPAGLPPPTEPPPAAPE